MGVINNKMPITSPAIRISISDFGYGLVSEVSGFGRSPTIPVRGFGVSFFFWGFQIEAVGLLP